MSRSRKNVVACGKAVVALCVLLGVGLKTFADDKYVATFITDTLTITNNVVVTATHTNLQEAVDAAVAGDTVWVQDGYIYGDSFGYKVTDGSAKTRLVINKKIVVRSVSGHYSGGAKIVGAWHSDTTAKGGNSVRGVCLDAGAELIGFTIEKGTTKDEDGHQGYGGGVHMHDGASTIRFCHITKGHAMAGGAVGSQNDNTIYDCLISESGARNTDTGGNSWGAIYNRLKAERCIFLNNPNCVVAYGRGSTMTDCVFVGNGGKMGSAAATYNCIFSNNTASVVVDQGTHYNAVFVNNEGAAASGATLYNSTLYGNGGGATSCKLYNSISYNINPDNATYPDSNCTYYNSYSLQATAANGNIDTALHPDPKITINPAIGIPMLLGNSPCIDTGDITHKKTDTDILGQARVNGENIDIGAVEFYTSDTSIEITGTPKQYGTSTPAYGIHEGYSQGDTVSATITDAIDLEDAEFPGYKYSCIGYDVYSEVHEPKYTKRFTAGDPLAASYTHEGYTLLNWVFAPSKVLITTHTDDGEITITSADGTVTYTDGWVPYNTAIKLTAPAANGSTFANWTMDTEGIEGDLTKNEITFTATRPRTIRAAYRFDETPAGYTYVSTLGSSHRDYGVGYTDLQTAIDATPRGGTVWVEEGFFVGEEAGYYKDPLKYNCRIVVTNAITLRSVSGTKESGVTIDGSIGGANKVRCLYIGDGAVVFGITAQNGEGGGDGSCGAVRVNDAASTISNSVIRACSGGWCGGLGATSNVKVYDLVITDCYCKAYGAAAWSPDSSLTIINSVISNNRGGQLICNGRGVFKNCVFTGNSAPLTEPTTYYCIFTNNTSSTIVTGGSHYNDVYMDNNCASGIASAGSFYNCTVYNNKSSGDITGLNRDAKAYNTISWGNNNATSVSWYNSCAPEAQGGENCITEDPGLIIDAATSLPKFRDGNSPCINAGRDKASGVGDVDIFGNPRISGGTIDIGATEYDASGSGIFTVAGLLTENGKETVVRFGVANPEYGTHDGYIPDTTTFTATMTEGDQIEDSAYPGYRFKCTGYTIFENPNAPTANADRSGTSTSFEYIHLGWAKLQWNFEKAYVNITTTTSGSEVEGDGWAPYNTEVTLTAPDKDGMTFLKWSGDIPSGVKNVYTNEIKFTATTPLNLRAVYNYTGTSTNDFYVSESGAAHKEYGAGYLSLQKAIDEVPEGGTVWIEDGTIIDDDDGWVIDGDFVIWTGMRCRVSIRRPITVRSVSGTEASGVIIKGAYHNENTGQKNGENAIRCAYVSGGGSLIGVICEKGAVSGGSSFSGGVYICHADSTLSHVTVRNCYGHYNGGITCGAKCTITDCTVIDNTQSGQNGVSSGIFGTDGPGDNFVALRCRIANSTGCKLVHDRRGHFVECVFENNKVPFDGYTYNSIFTNNASLSASGYHYGSLFMNNTGTAASGGTFYNCTFYKNGKGANKAVLINSVSSENTESDTECTYTNSCSSAAGDGENCITKDPKLEISKEGFPVPRPSSPCINAGNLALVTDEDGKLILQPRDIRGKKRVRGRTIDMGAFEAAQQGTVITLQ